MKNLKAGVYLSLALMALLVIVTGCSKDNPVVSTADTSALTSSAALAFSPPENRVQFSAHIATIDADLQVLTFDEETASVVVPEGCSIVAAQNGEQTPIEFADLSVGDLVKVCGFVQIDGSILANQVVLYLGGECTGYDLVIQDSIATIDYAAGTFTIYGVAETFVINEETVIWGMYPHQQNQFTPAKEMAIAEKSAKYQHHMGGGHSVDTLYAFTDLQPGYAVTIKAYVIDETTYLAADIKVLNCNYPQCIIFTDYLTAIDYDNSLVTFATEPSIGWVCPGAELLDADGGALLLEDFTVGDLVAVKGVNLAEDTLRISLMTLQ